MNKLINKALDLCLMINDERIGHAFYEYSGHVDAFSIKVLPLNQSYEKGVKHEDALNGKYYYLSRGSYDLTQDLISDLQSIIDKGVEP